MIAFAFAALLILASLVVAALEKAYFYLPSRELQRRATRGDAIAKKLLQPLRYDAELRFLLNLLIVILSSAGIALFASAAPIVPSLAVAAATLGLCFHLLPQSRLTPFEARLAAIAAPTMRSLVIRLYPILSRILALGRNLHLRRSHTGLFERADIDELLSRQSRQRDNRVLLPEIDRLRKILRAGTYHVKDCMIPMKKVIMIDGKEPINPVLVSDLHRSGHARFPVYDDNPHVIIGTLALERIADVRHHGSAADNVDPYLVYLHELDSLEQALRAFYETHQHLCLVVDSSGTLVGIITLTDILKQLMGDLEHLRFGKYDDRDAVAKRHR